MSFLCLSNGGRNQAGQEQITMYVGELSVGTIIFHARWGLGRVSRRDEACVVAKFGTRRHKLAYNEKVAVWASTEVNQAGNVNQSESRVAA